MKIHLAPISVLVTRPDPAGAQLCAQIVAHGGKAVNFPTIDFMPPHDGAAFAEAIATLGNADWLIFVSPRAVQESVPVIRRQWPEFPSHLRFAAVGAGTAKALHEAGYHSIHPQDEWSSEGLLDLPELQSLAGKRVAIVRGEGGREKLAQVLAKRGAIVAHVIAYQRVLPKIDPQPIQSMLQQGQIDVIVCSSFEGVRNLNILMGQSGGPLLTGLPLIVMSERIKLLARDLQYQTIWVARNASHDAILELLAQKRNEICQKK